MTANTPPPEPEPDERIIGAVRDIADRALASKEQGPVILGIAGAQGSGKSTLARSLERQYRDAGVNTVTLSIDDLYLTLAQRRRLAREVHPLFVTRGPPGTHDIALGMSVLDGLAAHRAVRLPRFDKAADDRAPEPDWPTASSPCDLVLLEGWCVGARPQGEAELERPVNDLEAVEDVEGRWRAHVNLALATRYRALFARIDRLVMLAAPSFEVIFRWRLQQEDELRARTAPGASGLMDEAAIARFIQHYERVTRHMLAEMPARVDLAIGLDEGRRPVSVRTAST